MIFFQLILLGGKNGVSYKYLISLSFPPLFKKKSMRIFILLAITTLSLVTSMPLPQEAEIDTDLGSEGMEGPAPQVEAPLLEEAPSPTTDESLPVEEGAPPATPATTMTNAEAAEPGGTASDDDPEKKDAKDATKDVPKVEKKGIFADFADWALVGLGIKGPSVEQLKKSVKDKKKELLKAELALKKLQKEEELKTGIAIEKETKVLQLN
jgi:hypothetical protein